MSVTWKNTQSSRESSESLKATTKPLWQSHDKEQCYCIESKVVPGAHKGKCDEVQLPRVDRSDKFGLTPKTSISLSLAKEIFAPIDRSS